MDSQTVRQKHKEFLFPCVANYYAEPVVITEAHGSSVKDLDGREYLDFFGGILTAGIGHSHPEFVKRLQDQVARLVHTSSVYPTVEQVTVAEKLTDVVDAVRDLPVDTQEALVRELEDRVADLTKSHMSEGQRARPREHVPDARVRAILRRYNPDL